VPVVVLMVAEMMERLIVGVKAVLRAE